MSITKYTTQGKNDCDSLPLGNGDIGITVWPHEKNMISMFISKTDSFSSALELLKIGKITIELNTKETLTFKSYELDITTGVFTVAYQEATVLIFVDYHNPCIRMKINSAKEITVIIHHDNWRDKLKYVDGDAYNRSIEYGGTIGQDNVLEKIVTYPDKIVAKFSDCIMWYHKNKDSTYEKNLEHQGVLHLKHLYDDPLKNRTFGACVLTNDEKNVITIGVLTKVTEDTEGFINELHDMSVKLHQQDINKCLKSHKQRWTELMNKSYIKIDGDEKAKLVDSGYQIQRYMNLCSSRGEFPIKFNGSIFTFTIPNYDQVFNPDYRMWGGCYWFQNTRLIYWAMLQAGDFEGMKPFFDMYNKAYDFVKAKTKDYYGFDGLLYPETMTPWGTHRNIDYGFKRDGVKKGEATNMYLRFYHSGMLELVLIMIEYYKFTKEEEFIESTIIKHAKGILDFYFNQYTKLDEFGKIIIYPSQALENWQDAKNPTDAVAGLIHVINELLKLPIQDKKFLDKLLDYKSKTPEIPLFTSGGRPDVLSRAMIKPAQFYDKLGNVENPELYAVFPYRLFSFDNEVEIGRETFKRRSIRNYFGWTQDGIQSATLAMPETSREFVEAKFTKWNELARFQGYWGPNFDWVPDQDHGNSASIALQKMLIQCVDEKIYLFPAWPMNWDVTFKVNAYNNTIVEGQLRNGEVINLTTTPANRINEVEICFDKHLDIW
ncbi:MAG: hypothetical protein KAG94_02880 [Clostridiales bacterium]|nr:hypothetical protein [Clostridiales bacterium]